MSNMFNPKTEKTSFVVSNIRAIKIIAIILGLLIIIGLIFLFWGLGKKYNKLNNNPAINKTLKVDVEHTDKFNFDEPIEAQLISSSLGTNNEILLRYLYKGKNTLVVLDIKTKTIKSIVTIKKGENSFKID